MKLDLHIQRFLNPVKNHKTYIFKEIDWAVAVWAGLGWANIASEKNAKNIVGLVQLFGVG